MASKPRPFVKSADTSTSAANSRAEIDKMLRRYGASAISFAEDIEKREIIVTFVLPDSPEKGAPKVPVKLPVSVHQVYDRLYGRPMRDVWARNEQERALPPFNGKSYTRVHNPNAYDVKKLAQAERVAWRNLVLWIDAALSAATIGLQTITEAFFAHAVVGAGGERMSELVEAYQAQLGPGVQRLLTATTEGA